MKLAIIGVGSLAGTLLSSLEKAGRAPCGVLLFDRDEEKTAARAAAGYTVADSAIAAVASAEAVLLAVRPQDYEPLLREISPAAADKTVISVAAGISTSFIASLLPGARVVRVMPNTAMKLGLGAIAVSEAADEEAAQLAISLFSLCGSCERVPEEAMNAVIGINGSGAALFYRVAAFMTEYAGESGIPAEAAMRLTAKTMEGAAAMLAAGEDPAQLAAAMCSRGGTTIAMLEEFERRGGGEAVIASLRACAERAGQIGR